MAERDTQFARDKSDEEDDTSRDVVDRNQPQQLP